MDLMREILFRGKRVANGEWVYGFYVVLKLVHYDKKEHLITDKDTGRSYEIDPATVGQYTGPKDKNGKRIFEGDVLRDDWGKIYEVFYTTKSCSFMVRLEHAPNEYEKGNYRLGEAWCGTIRVIGNIHDNPELLGGATNA